MRELRIAYLGNFKPSHSTETHVAASFEALGHHVLRIQEGARVPMVAETALLYQPDFFMWTQTYGLAETGGTRDERLEMLNHIKSAGIPTVAYHLDLWWDLDREFQLATEPYFSCDLVVTTDGCEDRWEELGVNHLWLPPAVFHEEAYDGNFRPEYACDVAFVGSWRQYAHEEHWQTRRAMLGNLKRHFGRRFRMFPERGGTIRGHDLTDLYASVKVVVGDSCLAGRIPRYWSDRVPETMGRGGFLIHPHVEGLGPTHPYLVSYDAGNWTELIERVEFFLQNNDDRERVAGMQAIHTRTYHTYCNRMQSVIDHLSLS